MYYLPTNKNIDRKSIWQKWEVVGYFPHCPLVVGWVVPPWGLAVLVAYGVSFCCGVGGPSLGLGSASCLWVSFCCGVGGPSLGLGSASCLWVSFCCGVGGPSLGLGSAGCLWVSFCCGVGGPSLGLGSACCLWGVRLLCGGLVGGCNQVDVFSKLMFSWRSLRVCDS